MPAVTAKTASRKSKILMVTSRCCDGAQSLTPCRRYYCSSDAGNFSLFYRAACSATRGAGCDARPAPAQSSPLQGIDKFNDVSANCFLFDREKATDKSGALAGREE